MNKDERSDPLAAIFNYNFYDTHAYTHTNGHRDSMTDPAQRAESVNLT